MTSNDRTATFSCGELSLDFYLRRKALQDARWRVSRVFVASDDPPERIAGYYTLSAASFEKDQLPAALARRRWVNRPSAEVRDFAGTTASGVERSGDPVLVCPSQTASAVKSFVGSSGHLDCAQTGLALTLVLADEVDVSRGDVIAGAADPSSLGDQFVCHIV